MKYQVLFSLKKKTKSKRMSSAGVVIGALSVILRYLHELVNLVSTRPSNA